MRHSKNQPSLWTIPKPQKFKKPKIGNDYFIPIWGYIRYTVPRALKKGKISFIAENVLLYAIIGVLLAFSPKWILYLSLAVGALLIIAEGFIYYAGYARRIFGYRKGFPKGRKALLIFAGTQMHAVAFAVLGFVFANGIRLIV